MKIVAVTRRRVLYAAAALGTLTAGGRRPSPRPRQRNWYGAQRRAAGIWRGRLCGDGRRRYEQANGELEIDFTAARC